MHDQSDASLKSYYEELQYIYNQVHVYYKQLCDAFLLLELTNQNLKDSYNEYCEGICDQRQACSEVIQKQPFDSAMSDKIIMELTELSKDEATPHLLEVLNTCYKEFSCVYTHQCTVYDGTWNRLLYIPFKAILNVISSDYHEKLASAFDILWSSERHVKVGQQVLDGGDQQFQQFQKGYEYLSEGRKLFLHSSHYLSDGYELYLYIVDSFNNSDMVREMFKMVCNGHNDCRLKYDKFKEAHSTLQQHLDVLGKNEHIHNAILRLQECYQNVFSNFDRFDQGNRHSCIGYKNLSAIHSKLSEIFKEIECHRYQLIKAYQLFGKGEDLKKMYRICKQKQVCSMEL